MATFFDFDEFGIPALETDGRNWQQYRASLELVTNEIGLIDYLVGTVSEGFSRALDTQTRFLLVSALPDPMAINIIHFRTATEIFDYLRRRYEKTTDDDSARVAAQPVEPIDARMHSHSDSKTNRTVETAVIEGSEGANGADENENGGMYLGNGATDEKHTTHPTETCDIDEGVGRDLEVAEEVGNASKDAAVEGKRIESCRNESIQGERTSALKRMRSTTATEKEISAPRNTTTTCLENPHYHQHLQIALISTQIRETIPRASLSRRGDGCPRVSKVWAPHLKRMRRQRQGATTTHGTGRSSCGIC